MLGKHLISSVLTQIPVFILGIISGIFSTRILGEEAKGVFSLFQANYLLFLLIFSFGIQTGVVYFISSKKYSEEIVAGITFTIFLSSSTILLLLLLGSYFLNFSNIYLPENYNSIAYLIALFILFLLSFFNSLITAFFQSRSKFHIINRIAIINSVFNAIVFPLIFFYLQYQSISAVEKFNVVLIITVLLLFINSLMWLVLYIKYITIIPIFSKNISSQIKEFISYSLLIYIGMFVNFFNYRLDLWIVNHYLDEKQLSHYSLAANINQIILYLSVTIASVVLPSFSSGDEESRKKAFIQVSRFSFLFFLIIVAIAFSVSNFIIPIMYGEEFTSTVIPFQILSLGILFSCITQLFSIYLVSSNKNIYNIIACSIGLIFTVFFDIYLIPKFYTIGASIATLISYLAIFIFTYIFVLSRMKIETKNLFLPSKQDFIYLSTLILKLRNK
ncbi:MAG: polysaccharide biosynthesis C-terminal domain-containing protein [Flavobacteriales bacterium]|nr:polysaccharide biosynthesis C-terminal domain-containing protein [Flavobacteriales bacterium]MCL4856590.1 polysaccharide biosynthesis C-terminal domain-containing protein [Flavobacteriales bacterium]